MKIEDALHRLQSDRRGLSEEEAKRRLQEIGPNELAERKKITPLQIFLGQFKDIFVIMLLAAILISVLAEETVDALTIFVIVVLNAVVGFIQEYRSEKAMEAMKKLTAPQARLMRDGKETIKPAREVVPGDIVHLESGDRVPADGRIIEAIDLTMDEAVLTGESTPVEKESGILKEETPVSDRKNMVFMATHATYGRGEMVVTATGMNTEFGKIAEMVQAAEEEATPLKRKLYVFAKKLAILVTLVSGIILLLEGVRGGPLIEAFIIAIALAVSAVPEGLPAIVTVTLALGARELTRRNAIIRKLSSVETLGSTTVICSDKTGTLTKGEMTVRKIYLNDDIIEVTGVGYEPKGEFYRNGVYLNPKDEADLSLLLRIGVLCNNARLEKTGDGWRILGDPTEGALIVAAAKMGIVEEVEKSYPRVDEVPFSSERKRMTTIHLTPDGEKHAYVKGAPEVVLDRCTRFLQGGRAKKLSEVEKEKILKANMKMAREALRVLGMAYKELPKGLNNPTEESLERDLVFVGLVGMIDPPRQESIEAVRLCEKAGIKAVMITGDHEMTATAIAKEIGILKEEGLVLTGAELDKISEEELERIVGDVAVYARVSPEHKIRIVRALKAKGHIVAMTGDGVNDAPALKSSDIGVAMGITGTDVTREAADMVLADDNFATIVNAVEGGRVIYDNIRKFIRFLLACNFDEVLVIGAFAMANLPLPLTATMILWINLVTDGGPAVALSMDSPTEDVMERPPRNPREGILHGMVPFIVASFLLQSLGTAFVFCWEYILVGGMRPEFVPKAQTMAFMQTAFFELIVVWNCRSEKHSMFKTKPWSNRFLVLSVIVSALLTASLCYVPPLSDMFKTVSLDIYDWALVLFIASWALLVTPEIFVRKKRVA